MTRSVSITGIGVVAPGGVGREPFWALLSAGRTATRRISLFDATGFRSKIAAEVDFDPRAAGLSAQQVRRMDRAAQFATVCTREAVADSGLDLTGLDPGRIAVSIGSAVGCTMGLEEEYAVLADEGKHWLVDHTYGVPHLYGYMVPSTLAVEVAWEVAAEGPTALVSTGCTSGLDAVGHGVALIEEGSADVVLMRRHRRAAVADHLGVLRRDPRDVGEQRRRRARVEAVRRAARRVRARRGVRGAGARGDVGRAAARGSRVRADRRVRRAQQRLPHDRPQAGRPGDGGGDPGRAGPRAAGAMDVDYINAHGSGTKQNDRHETAAFKRSLGERAYEVPVSSIKSMIGHSLGAIGSLEVAACALALDRQVVPPTANLHEADPECDLDYVPLTAREHEMDVVLTVGSGFGGFQSAMVLARPGAVGA